MTCSKIAWAMLACLVAATATAAAQTDAPAPVRVAQAPAPPLPLVAPPPPAPAAAALPAAPGGDNPIGSVATLQGSASVTRRNAATALQISSDIFKGDVLQTGIDGTLGITFDDDTTFTLKPNSRIAVDDFVYQAGGAGNAAVFNVVRGTVAFVAAAVAHTGAMKIDTPTSSLGIRGTTGVIEIPAAAGAEVSIKLYPDADGRVGRIEVFGRDGSQLGILSRGATGFAVRGGAAGGRFTAVPLQISAAEAERDRSFVRQAFSAQSVGRQINTQRRNLQRQNLQRQNLQRPNQLRPNEQRPGLQQRQGQLPGARPGLQRPLGGPPRQRKAPAGQGTRK